MIHAQKLKGRCCEECGNDALAVVVATRAAGKRMMLCVNCAALLRKAISKALNTNVCGVKRRGHGAVPHTVREAA